jgi:hypothetical protein
MVPATASKSTKGMQPRALDIGHDHAIRYFSYHMEDRAGIIIEHLTPKGRPHEVSLMFDLNQVREDHPGRNLWQVIQTDPLTLNPSIHCRCGDHGWIKEGKWQPV